MCTAAPKWASDGNKPESSEATTIGAQSGDGNEPESSDTITRGATADSNEIKSSPSQSRMAVTTLLLMMWSVRYYSPTDVENTMLQWS